MEPNKPPDSCVLPKIVDVEWKLEVATNAPGAGSDNLLYTVILKTEEGNDIRFTCGSQQLQDLVYKLKDVVRHCENVKNNLS
ncbi:COMM domain-containing protein [Phthorimaea operculella]|nr:COMM domain-containing protein [Phthorimaea operculella]